MCSLVGLVAIYTEIMLIMHSYTEKPKYRCPRCKTQTCSLPCYKRHQQRASCNGKRDPATYLKKRELATPTGIDRDYNYLKGVERTINDAGQDVRERGIPSQASRGADHGRQQMHEMAFQRYLSKHRITVTRAPKGMSRQKANQSRTTKKGQALWTVEWIDEDGEHDLRHNAPDSSTLEEMYFGVQKSKMSKAKRKMAMQADAAHVVNSTKRQKTSRRSLSVQDGPGSATEGDQHIAVDPVATPSKHGMEHGMSSSHGTAMEPGPEDHATSVQLANADKEHDQTNTLLEPPMDDESTALPDSRYTGHYYLLKPSTSTPLHVLIPLDSKSTIVDALQDRTVLEYPTVYTLEHPPDALPEGFVLEEEYLSTLRRDMQTAEALVGDIGRTAARENQPQAQVGDNGAVDAQAILDMLKRDVRV